MASSMHARRRFGAALALAGALFALGVAPVGAEPAAPPIPLGMSQIVDDVLGPQDLGFWNPAVPGTRILTPVAPGIQVACTAGFEPPLSCSILDMRDLRSPERFLAFADLPVFGGPPLRAWFDYPQWGDGSTGESTDRVIARWQRGS